MASLPALSAASGFLIFRLPPNCLLPLLLTQWYNTIQSRLALPCTCGSVHHPYDKVHQLSPYSEITTHLFSFPFFRMGYGSFSLFAKMGQVCSRHNMSSLIPIPQSTLLPYVSYPLQDNALYNRLIHLLSSYLSSHLKSQKSIFQTSN